MQHNFHLNILEKLLSLYQSYKTIKKIPKDLIESKKDVVIIDERESVNHITSSSNVYWKSANSSSKISDTHNLTHCPACGGIFNKVIKDKETIKCKYCGKTFNKITPK